MAGTSYQMLEVLALCDREKAQPPSITDNSDNLSGEENKYNEEYYSGVYIFWHSRKNFKSNLVLVVVLLLESSNVALFTNALHDWDQN